MAVGLAGLPEMHPISGVKVGVCKAGIKYENRYDLTVFKIERLANVAAVFTKNRFCAAPVLMAKKHISLKTPRYLIINTGYANAGTGEAGLESARQTCDAVAELGDCSSVEVLPFSTGVIGEIIPVETIQQALPETFRNMSVNNWALAAEAIMTTDTQPKGCSQQLLIDNELISITGIAKGSGMICPNMATMLAYVATDAKIESELLQNLLNRANAESFNCISVDGDTSTNDACILVATGKSSLHLTNESAPQLIEKFYEALKNVLQTLAQYIVRDAEGATKFITINVKNAESKKDAEAIAYTVAHSPLVKTAFFASDPNWGRILAAVGRAPIDKLDIDALEIYLNKVCIVSHGSRAQSYTEEDGQSVMRQEEISINIDLKVGNAGHTIWSCDLSYEYVKINAEYRS